MEKLEYLADILKQLSELYSELISVMELEKEALIRWNADETIELAKRKDTILYKEKVLEEARRSFMKKLSIQTGRDSFSLSDIITLAEDPAMKARFTELKKELTNVSRKLGSEGLALKILYRTNIGLVNSFFERLGITTNHVYGAQNKPKGCNTLVDQRG